MAEDEELALDVPVPLVEVLQLAVELAHLLLTRRGVVRVSKEWACRSGA